MEVIDEEIRAGGFIQSFNIKEIPVAAGFPYKHVTAIDCGNIFILNLSGILGTGKEGKLAEGTYAQAKQAIETIRIIVRASVQHLNLEIQKNNELDCITYTRADVSDLTKVAELNKAYIESGMPFTARTAVEVKKLPLNSAVEITAIAAIPKRRITS